MKNFNLDIDDYTIEELFDLLSLSNTSSTDDIEKSKNSLATQLFSQPDFNPDMRQNIVLFLDTACEKIKNVNNPSISEHGSNILIKNDNSNPLNLKNKSSIINIDSKFRDNYFGTSATNFSFELPVIQHKVTTLRVLSANIPLSYYSISETYNNNCFLIYDRSTGGSGANKNHAWLVKLADGNYDNSWFNDNIGDNVNDRLNNSILNATAGNFVNNVFTPNTLPAADTNSVPQLTSTNISFYVDKVNGRGTFTMTPFSNGTITTTEPRYDIYFNVNSNGSIDNNTNLQMKLGWMLGFRKNLYTLGDQQQVATSYITPKDTKPTYVSEGICNFNSPVYAYLAVDDYKTNYTPGIIPAFSTSFLDSNIIARFNFAALRDEVGALKYGRDSILSGIKYTREYFGPTDISKLKLTLYDEFGRIIDLNNMDWSVLIEFNSN